MGFSLLRGTPPTPTPQNRHQNLGQVMASEVAGPKGQDTLCFLRYPEKHLVLCVFQSGRESSGVPRPWKELLLPCGAGKSREWPISMWAGGSDWEDPMHGAMGLTHGAKGHINGASLSRKREGMTLLGLAWPKPQSGRGPLLSHRERRCLVRGLGTLSPEKTQQQMKTVISTSRALQWRSN